MSSLPFKDSLQLLAKMLELAEVLCLHRDLHSM